MSRPSRRRRRGSISVELALSSIPLVTLTVGAADWGWYFARQHTVSQIARDAALAGSTATPTEDPVLISETRAEAALAASHFEASDFTVLGQVVSDADVDGDLIQLDIQIQWEPLGGLVPMPETMRATSSFLLLYQ